MPHRADHGGETGGGGYIATGLSFCPNAFLIFSSTDFCFRLTPEVYFDLSSCHPVEYLPERR